METNNCMNVRCVKNLSNVSESHARCRLVRIASGAKRAFVYPACRGWNELENIWIYTPCTFSALLAALYTLKRMRRHEPFNYWKACHRFSTNRSRKACGCTVIFIQFYSLNQVVSQFKPFDFEQFVRNEFHQKQ